MKLSSGFDGLIREEAMRDLISRLEESLGPEDRKVNKAMEKSLKDVEDAGVLLRLARMLLRDEKAVTLNDEKKLILGSTIGELDKMVGEAHDLSVSIGYALGNIKASQKVGRRR